VFGVAPICRALAQAGLVIAPNTYYTRRRRGLSKRSLWDTTITEVLAGFYEPDQRGRRPPESLYGSVKMWAHLNREGIEVARCTVERLMRLNGWAGATRQTRPRTTIADPEALEQRRPPDLVDRQFKVTAPNRLWVADFTYVIRVRGRWCYTAFTIDAFADTIVGWHTTAVADAAMVQASFRDGIEFRARQGRPVAAGAIHHSDAGTQGGFNWSSQHLDHGGVGWDDRGSRCRRRRPGRDGSGPRIGRCGRRCARRAAQNRRELCNGSSGA
jgi:putative transposase